MTGGSERGIDMTQPQPEVWMRGPLPGYPPLLQPVAHSLLQSLEEVRAHLSGLTPDELWARPQGAASVGYHVRHAAGSLDRLLTYARGAMLSAEQLSALTAEAQPDMKMDAGERLIEVFAASACKVDRSLREGQT